MAQTSHKARILAASYGVVDPSARFLNAVIVVRPMLDYYLTLHDCETVEEVNESNLVYKIDSGWKIGDNIPPPPARKGAKAKPPTQDPLVGDANSTGKTFLLHMPLDNGLVCGACGADGEFIVVYSRSA